MDCKINVKYIRTSWNSCNYMFTVGVEHKSMGKFNYILSVLNKWFNGVEFFTCNGGVSVFLCEKK